MSLRHLYRDLNEMGVYPDIIKSRREHVVSASYDDIRDTDVIHVSTSRYYGYRFDIIYTLLWKLYQVEIYNSQDIMIGSIYNDSSSCEVHIHTLCKRIRKCYDSLPWNDDIECMILSIANFILDVLESH